MSHENTTVLDRYPAYEAIIGIEVHVQLKTETKIFCSCPNQFGCDPNTNICPVCTGQPGALPVLNKKVVEYAMLAGLATESDITRSNTFARKHYMYPDLPKNYQITQGDVAICMNGAIPIKTIDGQDKNVRLIRMHMEEDAGKNTHGTGGISWVDLNRAGTPLLEIVTHPDMANSVEAKNYLTRLHTIIRYLGISEANMDEGSFRADINISVMPKGSKTYGTRVELKNINSFRFIVNAIEYEIERHIECLEKGEKISQETRQWDQKNQKTTFMRSKEEAQDYRYFTEPDLPPVLIDDAWLVAIKARLPELPHHKTARFQTAYGIPAYDADLLTEELDRAVFFEEAAKTCGNAKGVCNWILRDVLGYLKEHKQELHEIKLTPQGLGELVKALDSGLINSKVAQDIFVEMVQTGKSVATIVDEKDLKQIGSTEELEAIVLAVLAANPDNVAKYKAGNERLFPYFIGQAMKETKGKGNPVILQELLKKHLS
ncbi:Asp-tRNA(Asn)/Glu-tRNA(Gln) amidotransferase subunit GatB [Candidatus Dependentiae bacterium]|nr:Asp-tRNA(Asn)/Glu-tRNA(Gln) amidotransferase subunit GatB [Candidatus Dependentiae bacterium]